MTENVMPAKQKERFERWGEAVNSDATNTQLIGQEPPETEEGFLVLTLIDGAQPPGLKEFVVTHAAEEVVKRKINHVEYFSTKKDGSKIGVSLEWRSREEAWRNLSDEDLKRIYKASDEAFLEAARNGKAVLRNDK